MFKKYKLYIINIINIWDLVIIIKYDLWYSLIYRLENLGLMKLNKFFKVRYLVNSRFRFK